MALVTGLVQKVEKAKYEVSQVDFEFTRKNSDTGVCHRDCRSLGSSTSCVLRRHNIEVITDKIE